MDDAELAIHVATLGGAVLRDYFDRGAAVDFKRKFDPVTVADKTAESAIVTELTRHRPGDGVMAEEGSGSADSGRRWIIDPLDGTVNFVHRIPHISVSVALYAGDDPVVGVVHDPLRNETFVAEAGAGASIDGSTIAVSAVTDPTGAVLATGFPYDHDVRAAEYAAPVRRALERVNGLRRMGSAALDLAWVAAGRYDGYWEMWVEPWDMAAGALLVTEAGGRVTDIDGARRRPRPGPIVASNGHLHPTVMEIAGGGLSGESVVSTRPQPEDRS